MLYYKYDTEDFIREQYYESVREEELLNKKETEYIFFRSKEGVAALLYDFKEIIKESEIEKGAIDGYFIKRIVLNEKATPEEIKELLFAIKNYSKY